LNVIFHEYDEYYPLKLVRIHSSKELMLLYKWLSIVHIHKILLQLKLLLIIN
jgi:hypothetical protein